MENLQNVENEMTGEQMETGSKGFTSMATLMEAIAKRYPSVAMQMQAKKSEDPEEWSRIKAEQEADAYNNQEGNLNAMDGIDCPECKNKGMIVLTRHIPEQKTWITQVSICSCRQARFSVRRLRESGLDGAIERMTFDSFTATEPWQVAFKAKAQQYARGEGGCWFFAGGQVGAGKSHICTAICREMLQEAKTGLTYMLWPQESMKLRGLRGDPSYTDALEKYLSADLLYIDDFLKVSRTENRQIRPTDAEIMIAFDILSSRYISRKRTLISSEWMLSEIGDLDEGLASRIYEMSRDSCCNISPDRNRNYRTAHM